MVIVPSLSRDVDFQRRSNGVPEQGCLFHDLFLNSLKAGTCATGKLSSRWKDEAFAGEVGCTVRALDTGRAASVPRPSAHSTGSSAYCRRQIHSEAKAAFIAAWNDRAAGRSDLGHATARPSTQHPQHKAHGGSMAPDWVPDLRVRPARWPRPPLCSSREFRVTRWAPQSRWRSLPRPAGYLRIPETEDTPRFDATFAVASAEIVVVKDMNVTPVK